MIQVNKKSLLQTLWDFVGIPFRLVLFDQAWLPRFGWTTLEDERLNIVLPHIQGRLLDIGAGPNTLVKRYGNGVGVDVFDWGGGVRVVPNTACLPFEDASFDTITLIACLNHIPNRREVLHEAKRLIKANGQLIITMIDPVLGDIGHAIWWYSEDKHRGGMKEGEVGGMWTRDIIDMCQTAGFRLRLHQRFVYGMNNFYLFEVDH
ncbi:MAG: class I SAM-dependent methyltransferase [Anaerolineales bacterium]|nr:class I SAM-dependent methyltransferase [Anaerolineales bacterium]